MNSSLDLRPGRKRRLAPGAPWLGFMLALAAASANALPPAAAEDDIGRFTAEKRFVDRLEEVRVHMGERVTERAHRAADRASELVIAAMAFLGVPYRRGGSSVEAGFDCSGFVKAIYQQTLGLVLPRRATEQAAATQQIDRGELQPGDLVFFNTLRRTFSHVGIYIGDNKFIHAPRPGAQVRVDDMGVPYWSTRFDGARRVVQPVSAGPQ